MQILPGHKFYHESLASLEDFDPTRTDYTSRELESFADAILWEDRKLTGDKAGWLSIWQLYSRGRREQYVGTGVVDPSFSSFNPDKQHMFKRVDPLIGGYAGEKLAAPDERMCRGCRKIYSLEELPLAQKLCDVCWNRYEQRKRLEAERLAHR